MRFAYADPPYVGRSSYYDHPDRARWDIPAEHVSLMHELERGYDGWALSCSSPSLADLLPGAPDGSRVAAWVKPFGSFKPGVRVAYSWEPVIFHRIADRRPGEPVGRDHVSVGITLRRGFTGAKPERFAEWVRVLLGALPDDEIVDVFPGSGACGAVFDRPRLV